MPEQSKGLDLSRKIGPLPLWGWGAVLIGGYLVYRRVTSAQAPADTGVPIGGQPAPSTARVNIQPIRTVVRHAPCRRPPKGCGKGYVWNQAHCRCQRTANHHPPPHHGQHHSAPSHMVRR